MTNLEIIEIYKNMKSVNQLCLENNLVQSNIQKGISTEEKTKKLADLCIREIVKAFSKIYGVI